MAEEPKLDPLPYEKRYPYNVGRSAWPIALNWNEMLTKFAPRPWYSQNEEDYQGD